MDYDKSTKLSSQTYWQIAFIYAFSVLFDRSDIAPIYSPPPFTPKSLEEAIYQDNNGLLDKLMCCFLSNALNRRKPIEIPHATRALYDYINSKIRSLDFDLDYNPLTNQQQGFQSLTSDMKLKVIHALVEWQLQDSEAVRKIVDHLFKTIKNGEDNPLLPIPFGYDQRKRAYWRFGDSPYLWCENPNLKKGCEFQIVCSDMEELQQFGNTIIKSKNNNEKIMGKAILNELIPKLEEQQKIQERKDRMKARQLAANIALETPKILPKRERKKPVRYNFNEDMNLDGDGDYEHIYKNKKNMTENKPTDIRRPLRSSGRLNGEDAIKDYMDMDMDMNMDMDADMEQKHLDKKDNLSWPTPPEQYTQLDEEVDIM